MADDSLIGEITGANKELSKTKALLKEIHGIAGQVGTTLKSSFSFSGANRGSSMDLGTNGASFGATARMGIGGSMPWLYTKQGAVAFGASQAALGVGAAAYSLMPNLQTALTTRAGYYNQSIIGRGGMTAADVAQRTLGALGGGVTSATDAMAAGSLLTLGYNFNPTGSSYLRAMQEVGGAARMMNIANPQAAQAIAGLHTGSMSSRLYQIGVSTLDTKTGTIRSTEDIYRQLYNKYFQGKGNITAQDIEISLREGFAGAELRNVLGFDQTQMEMVQKAFTNFSQGKGFDLANASGAGNPMMDVYRQQTSVAQTTESKADELLSGLTTATDAFVRMNQTLQGDNGLLNGLAKFAGFLQGFSGTGVPAAAANIFSTAGSIATSVFAYKGLKAAGLIGTGAKAAAGATGATGFMMSGGESLLAGSATQAAAKVATNAGRVALGRAIPVIGGAISGATGGGFLNNVAIGAAGGAIFGGLPGAAIGAGLTALGWIGGRAFKAMTSTSSNQSLEGEVSKDQWATSFLQRVGAPVTNENLSAIKTWMNREGGHWKNTASYNPLNTTMGATGAKSMNKVGVKAYLSWDQGLQATVDTLQGRGHGYENIIAALKQGGSSTAVLQAIQQSDWAGKSHYGYNLASSSSTSSSGSASTSVSSGGHTVNINLKIDKASDAEAIAFAKKVKELLAKDKTLLTMGTK